MPPVPGTDFVVIQTEVGLGASEAVLDGSSAAFHPDQRLDRDFGGHQVVK